MPLESPTACHLPTCGHCTRRRAGTSRFAKATQNKSLMIHGGIRLRLSATPRQRPPSLLKPWLRGQESRCHARGYASTSSAQVRSVHRKEPFGLAIRKSSAIMRLHIHDVEMAVPQEIKRLLERQIHAATRQIDRLVYDLYGLSEAEIRIVEGLIEYHRL